MTAYNTYAYSPQHYEECRVNDLDIKRLSEPFDAWGFDLTGRTKYVEEAKMLQVVAIADGTVDAVCFYFTMNLDEEISISTAPWVENCWTQSITFFGTPLQVKAGDVIDLGTFHKVKKIMWAQPRFAENQPNDK